MGGNEAQQEGGLKEKAAVNKGKEKERKLLTQKVSWGNERLG